MVHHTALLLTGLLLAVLGIFIPNSSDAGKLAAPNRECATCHIMWLSELKSQQLDTLIPYDPKPVTTTGKQDVASTERMCISCHDGFILDSRFLWQKGHYTHPVGVVPSDKVKIPTSKGKTIFPLNDDGKLYCGSCHSAHGVSWSQDESPVFLRMSNIGSSICMACHLNRSTGPDKGNHPIHKNLEKLPKTLVDAGSKFGPDNRVICQSCHRIHGAKDNKILAVSNKQSALCGTCHDDRNLDSIAAAVKQGTHPVNVVPDKTKVSKKLVNQGAKFGSDGEVICQSCHKPHLATKKKLLVMENKNSVLCGNCHQDRYTSSRSEAAKKGTHPVNISPKKVKIPTKLNTGTKGEVICETCHRPHGGTPGEHLLISSNAGSNLCQSCHQQQRSVIGTKHNLQSKPDQEPNTKGQLPANAPCSACHVPHGGKGPKLWARKMNTALEPMAGTCLSCHKKGGVAADYRVGRHSHPVGVNLSRLPGEVELPGFLNDGTKLHNKKGKVTCASCHDPHQWKSDRSASKGNADRTEEGDVNSSFLRLPADTKGTLCIGCHSDKRFIVNTDHDLSVTAPNSKNDGGKSLNKSGLCGVCHNVHNALTGSQLWGRKFGPGQDNMEKECRGCHRPAGIAEAKVPLMTSHPERIVTTNNGQPNAPLFDAKQPPLFKNGNQRAKIGVISCPTCHDPHKWSPNSNNKGPGVNTEGDALSSFLRDSHTAGKLCADCPGQDSLFRYKYFHWEQSRGKHPLY